jgi:hypothetical protein
MPGYRQGLKAVTAAGDKRRADFRNVIRHFRVKKADYGLRSYPPCDNYFLFSRAIRLEVSQRLPPIFCTSA